MIPCRHLITDNTSDRPSVTIQDTQPSIPMRYTSSEAPLTTNEQVNPVSSPDKHVTIREHSTSGSVGTAATDIGDNDNNLNYTGYQGLQMTNPLSTSPMAHQRTINGFSNSNGRIWPQLSPTSRKHLGQQLPMTVVIRSSYPPDETEV